MFCIKFGKAFEKFEIIWNKNYVAKTDSVVTIIVVVSSRKIKQNKTAVVHIINKRF